MTAATSSSILHLLLRPPPPPPPPPPPLSFFLKPLCISFTTITTTTTTILSKHHQHPPHTPTTNTLFTSLSYSSASSHNLLFCHSLSTSFPQTEPFDESLSLDQQHQDDETEEEVPDIDDERLESEEETKLESKKSESLLSLKRKEGLPTLTVKEKKELASYAHSLGKKLKNQLVGKSGVTESVATSFVETLEANELLKIKIHRTCPGELQDVVKQLEEATGSVVVGQIGRTVIIYRPSLTKLKAEEKKKKAMKVFARNRKVFVRNRNDFVRKGPKSKSTFLKGGGQQPRPSVRGRR